MADLAHASSETVPATDIAVIGMALRIPGARDTTAFWDNLRDGVTSIRTLSTAELDAAGESPARYGLPNYVPRAADLPDMEMFDAGFFGMSPKEAAIMDPQHRQFLECAWEALESAARPPEREPGPVGVFAGCGMGNYLYDNVCSHRDLVERTGMFLLRHTGNDKDFLATRASFLFDLRGPSVAVQTACSTSLVAVHAACQSLLTSECDMALAGGVSIELPHRRGYLHQEGEILSPDGVCRAFDHRAAGTVFGSGVGVVVLRRLADALRDGDPVQCVIKATAINNDGAGKSGYLAPSVDGQARAIVEAQGLAGVPADSIQYVECHGTGTRLGDPIEVAALTQAFRRGTERVGFCRIGSVKTNVGHLDTAAGVVGLIKVALALQNRQIPPSLGYEAPNPALDLDHSPFVVADRLVPWPRGAEPRRAAVNALGVGGTNAHAILEEAPVPVPSRRPAAGSSPELLLLSAKSPGALDGAARALAGAIARRPDLALPDIGYTLLTGRRHFERRRVLAASDGAEARALLERGDGAVFDHTVIPDASAVYLFPGGGSQHPGMARALYGAEPTFRAWVDEGLGYLPRSAAAEIRAAWLDEPSRCEGGHALSRPSCQLPAILILEVALARHWSAHGLAPAILLGHSMGENAAACVAGVLTFREAVGLVRLRGELFEAVSGGRMLSVGLDARALRDRLPAGLDLASVNAPDLCTVSGPAEEVAAFGARLAADGIETAPIAIDVAAHSRMLDPILPRFEAYLRTVDLRAPAIPIVSNVTGALLTDAQARDPLYWVNHLRAPVRFADGLATLAADPRRVYIEVGPGRTLSSLAKAQGTIPSNAVINTLPHPEQAIDARTAFLTAFGRAWATGLPVDPDHLWSDRDGRRVALPTYAFARERHFLEALAPAALRADAAPEKRADIAAWGYRPIWRQSAAPLEADGAGAVHDWLVFRNGDGIDAELVARLRAAGHRVTEVLPGDQFHRRDADRYVLCAELGLPQYEALVRALSADGRVPDRVLHLWLLPAAGRVRPGSSAFHETLERGLCSLLWLVRALCEPTAMHVTVVTSGMQRVADRALTDPGKATVLGAALVIPREFEGVTVRTIDLAPATPGQDAATVFGRARRRVSNAAGGDRIGDLDRLWDDLLAEPGTETVAYHRNRRWSQSYAPLTLDAAEAGEARFRERGVYLVTGGFGDLAGVVCEALARRYRARLILIGRTPLPERRVWDGYLGARGAAERIGQSIETVRRLERLGADVFYGCADISNPDELGAVVAEARAAFGAINGVIHTAGLVRDGLIAAKSPEDIEAVLAPKVQGTINLRALLRDDPLDVFVLFSSTSTDIAPAGQADYVAANAYLNAVAEAETGWADCRTVAIHWGIWNQIGLAARATGRHRPAPVGEAPRGPLFTAWVEDGAGGHGLEGRWRAADLWVLDEHRTRSGAAIWPGTGYIEIAAQVLREHGLTGPFEIEDLVFLRPLRVPDGETCRVRAYLIPGREAYRFEVHSVVTEGGRQGTRCHARGRIRLRNGPLAAAGSLAALPWDGPALPSAQEAQLRFGPRWRVLRAAAITDGEARASLALDPAYRADLGAGYILHPALTDIATGFAMALVPGYDPDAALWVPAAYGRIRVDGPMPAVVASRIRLSPAGQEAGLASFDVDITDAEGVPVMRVEGLTVKRLDGAGPAYGEGRDGIDASVQPLPAAPPAPDARLAALVDRGIRPDEGVEALFRAIGTGLRQVVVSSMDLDALRQRAAAPPSRERREDGGAPGEDRGAFVAPRTEMERTLAAYWSDLLGVARVGIDDDFFDLGGHSLIAVRLVRKIKERYATDLPISVLFEAPTIAACAALLGDRGDESPAGDGQDRPPAQPAEARLHVVPMQVGGGAARTPFFLCAGMFGNLLNLRHLALHLGAERPVYGLQARGLFGEHAPHETFEEMARDYCAEIRSVQPNGPYLLGGFSGGGLAAYAMAQRLRAEGEDVPLVVLLDTPVPQHVSLSLGDRLAMKAQDLQVQGLGFLPAWTKRRILWQVGRVRDRLAARKPTTVERFHNDEIEAAFRRALNRLTLEAYAGRVVLFKPEVQVVHRLSGGRRLDANRSLILDDNGWEPYALDLTMLSVSGDHDNMVLEPNVRDLANRLKRLLAEAEAASGPRRA
ncbi:beta-ketoacyl synthase N-terminal-like domain-containing protein [Methylobacterium sp. NEAU 140]|uniref:type I polyketide synthase n=1 Tax=Methylobacterium sp. NEAU 140 TaxID=3064945 RepID=UPI00273522D0|nr:type I polyketide synthase [Methylobacterium sp. NEAU 140]MDP4023751.1 beta-ketoacyl synthase N-terminal-like domain-containing protein [Methylobacterium sp. NEAU 140]